MGPLTWRTFRFAVPATCAWAVLAVAVAIARELPHESQWWVIVAMVAGGIVAVSVAVAAAARGGTSASTRESSVVTGVLLIASAIALWSHLPVERPRFGASDTFDVDWAATLRQKLVEAASGMPGPGNELVAGLAVGDTSLLGPELDHDMKAVSLTHLVAVSGANCAIVVAGVVAVVAVCGGGRWMRALAASLALGLFVVIVGPQPRVIRASVMAAILLVSMSFGEPARGVPVLGVAVVVLLLVNPLWALDVGFTLSVLATGALLILVAALVSIPLAAELVCQPIVVLLTPGLPVLGIVANVLTEPAAPIATITGLVAALMLAVSPALGELALWLRWMPAHWIATVAHVCAQLPLSRTVWPGGLVGLLLSLVLSSAVIALLLWPRARRASAAVVVLTLGVSMTTTVIVESWHHVGTPNDWLIAACDVGQGDSLLVRPNPESSVVMMIDTGRDETLLRACLNRLGIQRISLLVLTHYDIDHCGAYGVVVGRTDRALVGAPIDVSEQAIVTDLSNGGATTEIGHAGLSGDLGDTGFRWRELWPAPGNPGMQSGNPGSLVVRTDWAGSPELSAIFLGDLGEEAQRALLASTAIRPVTVVKVAHHGSADQDAKLYERLHALIGLVSVGVDNGYGHPTDRALGLLADSQTQVYRTDQHGLLLVRQGDHGLEVWSAR